MVFDDMSQRSVFSWNKLISGFVVKQLPGRVLDCNRGFGGHDRPRSCMLLIAETGDSWFNRQKLHLLPIFRYQLLADTNFRCSMDLLVAVLESCNPIDTEKRHNTLAILNMDVLSEFWHFCHFVEAKKIHGKILKLGFDKEFYAIEFLIFMLQVVIWMLHSWFLMICLIEVCFLE
ncbi:hypothetical protein EZV62_007576 [Acer yangbiense]|uniref:Uncharacterized protein n=1 Tax=Acer yangbiense TaxID=1000413 RepID=A0A5C7IB32_9ROSI|nr:hypothetical protein EZV62_007576 [Acer yangbiense]